MTEKVATRGVSVSSKLIRCVCFRAVEGWGGRTEIFVLCCIPRNDCYNKYEGNLVHQLADGNVPRVVFEAEVEDDLRCDGVDGGVVNPSWKH
jgi:hypothetical protein